jgi:hypothetical protein
VNPTLLTDIDFGRQQKDSLIRRVSAPKFDIPVKFRRKKLQKKWGIQSESERYCTRLARKQAISKDLDVPVLAVSVSPFFTRHPERSRSSGGERDLPFTATSSD